MTSTMVMRSHVCALFLIFSSTLYVLLNKGYYIRFASMAICQIMIYVIMSILIFRSVWMSHFQVMVYVIVCILTLRSGSMSHFQIMGYVMVCILTLRSARMFLLQIMIYINVIICLCIYAIMQPAVFFISVIIKSLA